jgi:hypothetical protein
MKPICVKIDTDRLRERLSRERGTELTPIEVHQWLNGMGFVLEGVWHCDSEDGLQRIKPDERLEVVRTLEENGVHFVDRRSR